MPRGTSRCKKGQTASDAIAWSNDREGTYIPTPVLYRDILYTLNSNGILIAYNAATGERLYRARVGGGGAFAASPVAADGKLYFASEDGDVFVAKAGPEYVELGKYSMNEVIMATPAISDGTIDHSHAGSSLRNRRAVASADSSAPRRLLRNPLCTIRRRFTALQPITGVCRSLLPRIPARVVTDLALNLGIAGSYWLVAELTLVPATPEGRITPMWPPAGIALAAMLLGGARLLPGIALGAFITTARHMALASAGPVAIGMVLQVVVNARLLRQLDFDTRLERVRDPLVLSRPPSPAQSWRECSACSPSLPPGGR